jgi:hypothetical protein
MNEIHRIIQERQSARFPFNPNRKVSKENLQQILDAGPLGTYSSQHAKLRHSSC